MKKKVLITLLFVLIYIICVPSAKAACKYHYYSNLYGYTSVKVNLNENNKGALGDALYLNMVHGVTISEKKAKNQNIDHPETFWDEFVSDPSKCPNYMYFRDTIDKAGLVGTFGDTYGELYYNKADLIARHPEVTKDLYSIEHYILVLDNIEDNIPGYDKYAAGDDFSYQGANYPKLKGGAWLNCYYNSTTNGFTSTVLRIYKTASGDLFYGGYVPTFNSDRGGIIVGVGPSPFMALGSSYYYAPVSWGDDYVKIENWDSIKGDIAQKGVCPYYIGVDYSWFDQAMLSYDRATIKKNSDYNLGGTTAHILTSLTISNDKAANNESYDPSVDGKPATEETQKVKAWGGSSATSGLGGREGDWDPNDPYGFHIGDNFCSEEKVVKALKAFGNILTIAKLALPLLIIIMGTLDFAKAVIEGKSDFVRKKAINVGYRVLAGVFVFFIPALTNAFFNGLAYYKIISDDVNQCQNCLLNPNNPNTCSIWSSSEGSTPVYYVSTDKLISKPSVEIGSTENGNNVSVGELQNGNTVSTTGNLVNGNEVSTNGVLQNDKSVEAGELNNKPQVSTSEPFVNP